MEKRRNFVITTPRRRCPFIVGSLLGILMIVNVIRADTVLDSPALSRIGENFNIDQGNTQAVELRKRQLTPSEQAQILSDVQQHRSRFGGTRQRSTQNTSPLPTLAKYKVDRAKQQQQQQQQQQQFSLQQGLFETAATQTQPLQAAALQSQQRYNRYNNQRFVNNAEFNDQQQQQQQQRLFDNEQSAQLQSYYEKQRQLEILQRQRERLLAEQQELRRQQEFLRLQQLQQLQSSTTTTTSTQQPPTLGTTFSPLLLSSPSARRITPAESDLFLKAIANHQKKFSTAAVATTPTPTPTPTPTQDRQQIPKDILSLIEAQESQSSSSRAANAGLGKSKPQIQIIYQTEKPSQMAIGQKSTSKTKSASQKSTAAAQREALLRQLKLALVQSPLDEQPRNLSTRELTLPNGKTVQLIQAPNDLSQLPLEPADEEIRARAPPTTSIKPPNAIFEELTKGVLPPGADFEVLRHKLDGKLEEVGRSPLENDPAKKVTFVVLEEQPDGSYKVQGVKGNSDQKESGDDVESIVERIKSGELKLPPSSAKPASPTVAGLPPTAARSLDDSREAKPSLENYVTAGTTPSSRIFDSSARTSTRSPQKTHFVPTMAPVSEIVTRYPSTTPVQDHSTEYFSTTRFPEPTTASYAHFGSRSPPASSPSPTTRSVSTTPRANVVYEEDFASSSTPFGPSPIVTVAPPTTRSDLPVENLARILKRQGLYAMAKFLGQSGLDAVLNDTGPYTIFAPTDKAFRTLLVQLGGPEKAEQKFRENPRLLSGLLLHHVIPGAFRIDSLQDEMTGVSLAGTQLRVNVYAMHDVEWNDVKVTTINGARVVPDKQDVEIPQGITHAIDRVMFPLPVGDLVQTLQADRERRFTVFLRALHASGLEETLTGLKTYTIFAPTDTAFTVASASPNGSPPWLDDEDNKEAAKTIVSRHIIPSSLYTAGMRYYQQKETLSPQASLHIHKNSGRIKVNNAQVITHNIPATNGVIHAVDSLL